VLKAALSSNQPTFYIYGATVGEAWSEFPLTRKVGTGKVGECQGKVREVHCGKGKYWSLDCDF